MKKSPKPVVFSPQVWRDFKSPPGSEFPDMEDDGYGPSGLDIFVYYPEDERVSSWVNWSGCPSDIKNLKKNKALWCYSYQPHMPKEIE
jgi:hypothetical protein